VDHAHPMKDYGNASRQLGLSSIRHCLLFSNQSNVGERQLPPQSGQTNSLPANDIKMQHPHKSPTAFEGKDVHPDTQSSAGRVTLMVRELCTLQLLHTFQCNILGSMENNYTLCEDAKHMGIVSPAHARSQGHVVTKSMRKPPSPNVWKGASHMKQE
jgi:hypothetical protein